MRVPQFLGGYLAASWILVEFIDRLVTRYPMSPYLVEFGLVALASMIPTVALIAYFHGKPGRDRWIISEEIGRVIPKSEFHKRIAMFPFE